MARHDRLVDLVAKDLGKINQGHDCKTFKHSAVKTNWFHQNIPDNYYFKNITNTPDIVIVMKTVLIIEMDRCIDLYLDTSCHQPLVSPICQLGYQCKCISLIFGSLGHIHKSLLRGLLLGGLHKKDAKRLPKCCSISATISSMESEDKDVLFTLKCSV